jgi:glycosyltransferase involved in cell wall biosynthesis
MRTVLLVGNFLSASVGTRGVCEELAVRLPDTGWSVLTTSSKPARVARLVDIVATISSLRRHYDLAQVDVYSGAAFIWAEAAAFALRRARKPYILTLHGGGLPHFARQWPRRVRRLLASAGAVTAPSGFLVDAMRAYRPDLQLIPNAIELARYPFRLRDNPAPRLVWLRAFHKIYDPTLAIRALALLRKSVPAATLQMIGPDKHDGSLEQARATASELGVGDAVRFHGRVPKTEIPSWMDCGDIFLNTTTIDNSPVTVIEAMACGSCIVSTNVGGIPHLIADGAEGLMVPPADPAQMAAAIERILTNRALASRFSVAARAKAETFDWSAVLPKWHALLHSVAVQSAPSLSASSAPISTKEESLRPS